MELTRFRGDLIGHSPVDRWTAAHAVAARRRQPRRATWRKRPGSRLPGLVHRAV